MRFEDIPKFIANGNYQINVFLTSLESQLEEYTVTYGLELNPEFQRGYVWTEEQQIAYVEFLLHGGKTANVIYFNSPAYNDNYTESSQQGDLDQTILCVDGLQRLTALLRFMRDEIKVFGHYYSEFEDKKKYSMRYSVSFNINGLLNKKDVLEWYVQFNSGGTVHTDEEINRVKAMIREINEGVKSDTNV